MTDTSSEICDIIKVGTKNPNIVIQKVVHSYSELQQHSVDVLQGYVQSSAVLNTESIRNGTSPLEIVGAGVSVKNNAVTVTVKNYNTFVMSTRNVSIAETTVVDMIKSIIPSEKNGFDYVVENGGYIQDQATYYPGALINSSKGSFTMGYRGIIEHPTTGAYVKGFWVAGHCVFWGSTILKEGSE